MVVACLRVERFRVEVPMTTMLEDLPVPVLTGPEVVVRDERSLAAAAATRVEVARREV